MDPRGSAPAEGLLSAYLSTLLVTVTNPMTILSFAAAFAGLGLASGVVAPGAGLLLVSGVFMGSALWWGMLSGGVGLVRGSIGPRALQAVNRVSGLVLLGFGIVAVLGIKR